MDVLKALKIPYMVKMTNMELYWALSKAFSKDPKTVISEVIALGV